MSPFRGLFVALAPFVILSTCQAGDSAVQTLNEKELNEVREETRRLARDLHYLLDTVVFDLKGKEEAGTYAQANRLLGELLEFETSLRKDVSFDQLRKQFEGLDTKLHILTKTLRSLGPEERTLQRAATHLQFADDRLHDLLYRGDTSGSRKREMIERQLGSFLSAVRELEQAGALALSKVKDGGRLSGDLHQLRKATWNLEKQLQSKADSERLKEAFLDVNHAWEKAARGLSLLPFRDNVYLLRSADRVEKLHERLYRLFDIKGERPHLIIRT